MHNYENFIKEGKTEENLRNNIESMSKFGMGFDIDNLYYYLSQSSNYIVSNYNKNLKKFYIIYKTDYYEILRFPVFINYKNLIQIRDDSFGDTENVTINNITDLDEYLKNRFDKCGEYDYANEGGDAVKFKRKDMNTIYGSYYNNILGWVDYSWNLDGSNQGTNWSSYDINVISKNFDINKIQG